MSLLKSLVRQLLYPRPHLSAKVCTKAFAGKVCLITGASSGIGHALAHHLIRARAHLILISRNASALERLVEEAHRQGVSARCYAVDLRDAAALSVVIAHLREEERIDYFFANAGKSICRRLSCSVDRVHDFDRTLSTNYRGHVALLLGCLSPLRAARGTIIYSNSVSLLYPPAPGWSAYHASKAAMDIWLRTAQVEWYREIKIRNAYLPLVHTPMSQPNERYRTLPGYEASEAALLLLRLSLRTYRTTYRPWWAWLSAPVVRLLSPLLPWIYTHTDD